MTLDANRADLERHARDFAERTGFTYTVLRPGGEEVIGRLCIYPAEDDRGDAHARSWVRADVAKLDRPLHSAVSRTHARRGRLGGRRRWGLHAAPARLVELSIHRWQRRTVNLRLP